jgi:hypothetical protein
VKRSAFKGKVLLIVNTASKCGFTPQFAGLEALHEKYAGQGLAVLGFPVNQFGSQDPGSNEEIGAVLHQELRRELSDDVQEWLDVNGKWQVPGRARRHGAAAPLPVAHAFSEGSSAGLLAARRATSKAESSGTSPSSWSMAATRAVLKRYRPRRSRPAVAPRPR